MLVQVSLKIELEASASVTQMEQQIQQAGQEAMREAMKQGVRLWEEQHTACPHCGAREARLEGTSRRIIATLFGRVQVQRRRFRCQKCQQRCTPANRLLAELAGARMSGPLQEAAVLAGCRLPLSGSRSPVEEAEWGERLSAEEIRLLTNQGGKQRAKEQQQSAERVCASLPISPESVAAQADTEPRLLGLDGGWTCSREQRGGMEGKVAVLCSHLQDLPMQEIDPSKWNWMHPPPRHLPKQRHRLLKRRYVATFAASKQIGQLAKAAASELCEDAGRPVVLLADGADWIKSEQRRHFPQATCILDWAHLWREVSHAVRAAAREKELSAPARDCQLALLRSLLWKGQVDGALAALEPLALGLSGPAAKAVKEAITYLSNQRGWIGSYQDWRKQGYPVCSGMIERAVALVINRRMRKARHALVSAQCHCRGRS